MMLSSGPAKLSRRAARTALTTASLKRSTGPETTQCSPQTKDSRRAVASIGVSAMIGTAGRSRAALSAVVPEWVKQQIALTSVDSATSRAAAVIASATERRSIPRPISMASR